MPEPEPPEPARDEEPAPRIRPLGAPADLLRPTGRVAAARRRGPRRGLLTAVRALFRRRGA